MQQLENVSYSVKGETTVEEHRGSLDQINRRQFKMLNFTSRSPEDFFSLWEMSLPGGHHSLTVKYSSWIVF